MALLALVGRNIVVIFAAVVALFDRSWIKAPLPTVHRSSPISQERLERVDASLAKATGIVISAGAITWLFARFVFEYSRNYVDELIESGIEIQAAPYSVSAQLVSELNLSIFGMSCAMPIFALILSRINFETQLKTRGVHAFMSGVWAGVIAALTMGPLAASGVVLLASSPWDAETRDYIQRVQDECNRNPYGHIHMPETCGVFDR